MHLRCPSDGSISRDEGIAMVMFFLVYAYMVRKRERAFSGKPHSADGAIRLTLIFILSMGVMFVSAHFIVESATGISAEIMIPSVIIGLFLIAIGTTLPELTFSLKAVMSRHKEIALGDVLGNVAIDSTFTIGVIAIIKPVSTGISALTTSILFMVVAGILVARLLNAGKMTWKESLLLFGVYAVFVLVELGGAL